MLKKTRRKVKKRVNDNGVAPTVDDTVFRLDKRGVAIDPVCLYPPGMFASAGEGQKKFIASVYSTNASQRTATL